MKKYYFFVSLLSLILLAFLTLTMTKIISHLSFIINSLLLVIWAFISILFHRTLVFLKALITSKFFYILGYFYVMGKAILITTFSAYRLVTFPRDIDYSVLLLILIGIMIYIIIRAIWVYKGKKPY
ncbi:hypothetical protein LmYK1_00960 [Ligilactobacillus murinus]|nr:hypothetical protein LmYK1_00960 [Ligilactobacillus murinus]GFI63915.1 hypothetical protein IMSAG117_01332 [Lactobacillaceae bacterium]